MSKAERSTTDSGTPTAVARTVWNGVVLAETTRPVLLEGNVYFPPEDVRHEHLGPTRAWSLCAWKGLARYYTVRAGGQQNTKAAWYYPHPKETHAMPPAPFAGNAVTGTGGSPDSHVPAGHGPEEELFTGLWRITNLGTH
jgi:nucleotidyltransferase-like protein